MCIAAYVTPSTNVTNEVLENCFSNNDDGAGFIVCEPGAIKVYKGYFECAEFVKAIRPHLDDNRHGIVFHCRISTHGATDKRNCHPHRTAHGAAFVHNGILSIMEEDKKREKSDTKLFAEWCFPALPADWYENTVIKALIEHAIGGANKIVYVAANGHVEILNEQNGDWENGVWFSNNTWRYKQSKTVYYGGYGYADWNKYRGAVHAEQDKDRKALALADSFQCCVCHHDVSEDEVKMNLAMKYCTTLCINCVPKTDELQAEMILDAIVESHEDKEQDEQINRWLLEEKAKEETKILTKGGECNGCVK